VHHHESQDCCHWTERVSGSTQENIRSLSKLVTLRSFQVNPYHRQARKSTAMSLHDSDVDELYCFSASGSSSPSQKKPKIAAQAIAHNDILCGWEDSSKATRILPIMGAVIGSLTLDRSWVFSRSL